jgi:ADP-ribosylglycohydrolase
MIPKTRFILLDLGWGIDRQGNGGLFGLNNTKSTTRISYICELCVMQTTVRPLNLLQKIILTMLSILTDNHDLDSNRGYGATLRRLLRAIKEGQNWSDVSKSAFDGQGSMGNGAAMRVCPIGAYYYDNLQKAKLLAIKSSEVTHSNIKAITGTIAIAIGTALTTKMKSDSRFLQPLEFIDKILEELPDSDTKSKISKSNSISYNYQIETVKSILGNGTNMTAQDTVPFAIWCTAYNLENFEEALWKAVSILGDRDTICAMVGGMTIMSTRTENIPNNWIAKVEKFETSIFRTKK